MGLEFVYTGREKENSFFFFGFIVFFVFFFLETGFLCIDIAVLELTL